MRDRNTGEDPAAKAAAARESRAADQAVHQPAAVREPVSEELEHDGDGEHQLRVRLLSAHGRGQEEARAAGLELEVR